MCIPGTDEARLAPEVVSKYALSNALSKELIDFT